MFMKEYVQKVARGIWHSFEDKIWYLIGSTPRRLFLALPIRIYVGSPDDGFYLDLSSFGGCSLLSQISQRNMN